MEPLAQLGRGLFVALLASTAASASASSSATPAPVLSFAEGGGDTRFQVGLTDAGDGGNPEARVFMS